MQFGNTETFKVHEEPKSRRYTKQSSSSNNFMAEEQPFAEDVFVDTHSQNTRTTHRLMPQSSAKIQRTRTRQYFKRIFNRTMNVSHKELLEASDVNIVTRKQMRIYGIANLIFFILEVTFMVLTLFSFTGKSVFYVADQALPVILYTWIQFSRTSVGELLCFFKLSLS